MKQMLLLAVIVGSLAGCSSNPLSNVSDLGSKDLNDVSKVVFPYAKVGAPDEAQKLRHWKLTGQSKFTNSPEMAGNSLKSDLGNFDKYCSARNGKMSEPTPVSGGQAQFATEVACMDKETNKVIFMVAGGFKPCKSLSIDNGHYDAKYRTMECNLWVDAFAWKAPGEVRDVGDDFGYESASGYLTKEAINAASQQRLAESERQAAAFRAEQERQAKVRAEQDRLRAEAEQREREQAIRDLPKIKTVGQKICHTEEITTRRVIGTALGQPMYGTPIKRQAQVTAFTENSSGSKIQLRISGMRADGENLDRIDGDVVYQTGGVIWDEASNWKLCY